MYREDRLACEMKGGAISDGTTLAGLHDTIIIQGLQGGPGAATNFIYSRGAMCMHNATQ